MANDSSSTDESVANDHDECLESFKKLYLINLKTKNYYGCQIIIDSLGELESSKLLTYDFAINTFKKLYYMTNIEANNNNQKELSNILYSMANNIQNFIISTINDNLSDSIQKKTIEKYEKNKDEKNKDEKNKNEKNKDEFMKPKEEKIEFLKILVSFNNIVNDLTKMLKILEKQEENKQEIEENKKEENKKDKQEI